MGPHGPWRTRRSPSCCPGPDRRARRHHERTSRWAALAVLCAGTLMTILDGNIVTVAMPASRGTSASPPRARLGRERRSHPVLGGLLLLAGRLGDLVGRRRMFTAGLAVFTARPRRAGSPTDRACWSPPAPSRASAGR